MIEEQQQQQQQNRYGKVAEPSESSSNSNLSPNEPRGDQRDDVDATLGDFQQEVGQPVIGECTGVAFEPEAANCSLFEESLNNFNRDQTNSFQTVLEVAEEEEEEPEVFSEAVGTEEGAASEFAANADGARLKWSNSVRRVWQSQRVVGLLRRAGDRVRAGRESLVVVGRQLGAARDKLSPGGDGLGSVRQRNEPDEFNKDDDEPEFLNSKKLRSAEIQM